MFSFWTGIEMEGKHAAGPGTKYNQAVLFPLANHLFVRCKQIILHCYKNEMTTQCEFGKSLLLGKPSGLSELAACRPRCSLGVRPLLQTQQEHTSHVLSSKLCFQQMSICKLYFLLESSGLLPSDAIFTSGNNVLKGRPKSSTQESWQYNSGDRSNWINPVLPNCTNCLVPQNQLFHFQQKYLHCFSAYLAEDINILDLMSQLSGSKETDEQCSPDLVQQLPITLKVKFEQTKQTMLIHDTIFLFPENDFG